MTRILTAWHHDNDPTLMPNLVLAADEWLMDANDRYWDDALADEARKWGVDVSAFRLMWITVPEASITGLFTPPEVPGTTEQVPTDDSA